MKTSNLNWYQLMEPFQRIDYITNMIMEIEANENNGIIWNKF